MKIAVTYEEGQVFQHFGHTEQFKVYEVQDGKVLGSQVRSAEGSGHGALAGLLKSWGVDALLCGGIGGGARMALQEAGIALYGGVCVNLVYAAYRGALGIAYGSVCSARRRRTTSCCRGFGSTWPGATSAA